MFLVRIKNRIDRLLDAQIDDAIAIVRQDDVHEIFADVVDVALHGGEHHRALCGRATLFFHERFKEAHRSLHRFG